MLPRLLLVLPLLSCRVPAVSDGGITDTDLLHHPNLASQHLTSCDDAACGEPANPPLGGPHCPTWSPCRVFTEPVKRCNWLHNLEHGHVVLAYNCPAGCPDELTALTALWNEARAAGNTRVVLTPDRALPDRVAALVWGWGWVGNTVNADAIRWLMTHQDDEAPERGLSCQP